VGGLLWGGAGKKLGFPADFVEICSCGSRMDGGSVRFFGIRKRKGEQFGLPFVLNVLIKNITDDHSFVQCKGIHR
jgi:hypothetical protein